MRSSGSTTPFQVGSTARSSASSSRLELREQRAHGRLDVLGRHGVEARQARRAADSEQGVLHAPLLQKRMV